MSIPDNDNFGEQIKDPSPHKGTWSDEENKYLDAMIKYFKAGILPLKTGDSLREYLSKSLCCKPMRITKKFAKIGITNFSFSPAPAEMYQSQLSCVAEKDLEALRQKFLNKIKSKEINNFMQYINQQKQELEQQIQQQKLYQDNLRRRQIKLIKEQNFRMNCLLKVVKEEIDKLKEKTKYEKKYKLKTPVLKFFPGYGWFSGKITGWNTRKQYIITYTDGDRESYEEDESELATIIQQAIEHQNSIKKDEKKRKQCSLSKEYENIEKNPFQKKSRSRY